MSKARRLWVAIQVAHKHRIASIEYVRVGDTLHYFPEQDRGWMLYSGARWIISQYPLIEKALVWIKWI